MRDTVTTDGPSRRERLSLTKAFDWRAGRTWWVFCGSATAHGIIAGTIPHLARVIVTLFLPLDDPTGIEALTILIAVILVCGWVLSVWLVQRRLGISGSFVSTPNHSSNFFAGVVTWRDRLVHLTWSLSALVVAIGAGLLGIYLIFGSLETKYLHSLIILFAIFATWNPVMDLMRRFANTRQSNKY